MTDRSHRLAWVPPFLVGASAAIAAEVAVSLLLYAGPGMVRSLTVILTICALALAGGLWSAPAPGPGSIDRLRRRWVLCLVAFTGAAVFSLVWSVPDVASEARWSQGLGLTLLAALPLFSCGSVLGGVASIASTAYGSARTGAAAALGASAGFVATGLLLPRTPLPATLLLACLVLLSLGGMAFGSILANVSEVDVRAERESKTGPVRVEDRRSRGPEGTTRVMLEGSHERRRLRLGAEGTVPWDLAIARPLMPGPESPWKVLVVGGGASTLAHALVHEHPTGTVEVLERSSAIVDLGREHFDTRLAVGDAERIRVDVGNLEDLVKGVRARYDAVFVDASALAPIGGALGLSREARGRLVQAVDPSGILVWGPTAPEPGVPELADGWARLTFDRRLATEPEQVLAVMSPNGAPQLPDTIEGFVLRNGELSQT